MDAKELREKAAQKEQEAEALVAKADDEKRDATDEERTQCDTLLADADKLKTDAERVEKIEARKAEREAAVNPGGMPEVREQAVAHVSMRLPHRKLQAFRAESCGSHEAAVRRAYDFGMQIRAQLGDAANVPPALLAEAREYVAGNVEQRVLSGSTVGAGGFSVPEVFHNNIIDIVEEDGVARSWCQVVPMTTDTERWPRRTGGVTAYWVGDADATTASDPSGDNVELVAKELSALTRVPLSLMGDSAINLGDYVAKEMGRAFATAEDQALIDGDGTSTYGGIVGFRTKMVDGNHAASYIDATSGDDEFDELLLPDINKLVASLPQYAGANDAWYMSRPGYFDSIVRLRQALSGETSALAAGTQAQQHMGYPVNFSPQMPKGLATAYNATVMMLFGDLSMAVMLGDRQNMSIRQSDQRYFEYRQIGILATERIDIQVHDIGDASTTGPIIGLRGTT